MGDTGSLAVGTGLGALLLLDEPSICFCCPSSEGSSLAETMSVIIAGVSFRLFGRRIFRMAPFHHHFELRGWPETTVIIRFWILAGLLADVGSWHLLRRFSQDREGGLMANTGRSSQIHGDH